MIMMWNYVFWNIDKDFLLVLFATFISFILDNMSVFINYYSFQFICAKHSPDLHVIFSGDYKTSCYISK